MAMLALFSNGVFALHAYRATGGTTASGHTGRKLLSRSAESSCIWLGLSGPFREEIFKGHEYVDLMYIQPLRGFLYSDNYPAIHMTSPK